MCVSVSDLDGVHAAELKEKTVLNELSSLLILYFFPLRCYNLRKVELKMQRIGKKEIKVHDSCTFCACCVWGL